MDHERWRRLEYLYHMVLEREPDQRITFIAEACAGDEDLRRDTASAMMEATCGNSRF